MKHAEIPDPIRCIAPRDKAAGSRARPQPVAVEAGEHEPGELFRPVR
jgi:hypothetical protein